jgi:hypothetical protein
MSGIPLFNQYALAAASDDKELFTDYGTLAKYLSFVRLGKAYLHLDRPEDVDIYLRSLLFSGDLCRSDLEPSAANICRLISKYSQNRSITSAIRIVSDRIFQSRPLDASKNFYLLDGSQFSLTQQEAVSDQHCSVFDAFCPISR